MDKQIEELEINQKAIRKSADSEGTMVDLLNQEMKELQDSQKQIEEFACDLYNAWCGDIVIGDKCKWVAKKLMALGYRKILEGAVVLTEDNAEEIGNMVVKSPQMQEAMLHLIKAWQKETAEKFAKRLKARYMPPLVEWDEISIGGLFYEIDEICKELVDE